MTATNANVFAEPRVRFHIVRSATFPEHDALLAAQALIENGAEEVSASPSTGYETFPLDSLTHIISTTVEFPQYDAATELGTEIKVVKPDWIVASIAKRRQAHARQYSPDPRMFFSGIIVSCADLPEGDRVAIEGYVLAVGGLYSSALTRQVTHVVALSMDSPKAQAVINKQVDCRIVLPHWIDDCLRLGRRISDEAYCFPDPAILDQRENPDIPMANREDLVGSSDPFPAQVPNIKTGPKNIKGSAAILNTKLVMLSEDLDVSNRMRITIEDLVLRGGGSITLMVQKADILICQYRESSEYRIASRARKDVGNLAWLYHLITHNAWSSPTRRLLHYPVSRDGLPGFQDFRISVSNYNGEARIYLENLAKAAGAEFTKTMKDNNTHLITAHSQSEKCLAAKEWNIAMVNHLWLEESYAKWQVQPLSNPRYTQFPARTNLGEVVGETSIDKAAIEMIFFPPIAEDSEAEGDISIPSSNPDPRLDQTSGPDELRLSSTSRSSPLAGKKSGSRRSESIVMQTPVKQSFSKDHEPVGTPVTASRSAKDKAAAKLHDLALDIALFQKESKRVGGVIHGGRKKSSDLVQVHPRKRSNSIDDESDEDLVESHCVSAKKRKVSGLPPIRMRILATGYKRWLENQKLESDERAQLRELGIQIVQDVVSCTHVASPRIVRTQKFICAVARCPNIINTTFLDDCLEHREALNSDDYILEDPEYEHQRNYDLSASLRRAKSNGGQLLKGYRIFCTDSVPGGFDTFRAITQANGGDCYNFRGRSGWGPTASPLTQQPQVFLVSTTTPEDSRLWPRFRQIVAEKGLTPRIKSTDWLLNVALSQLLDLSEDQDLREDDLAKSTP